MKGQLTPNIKRIKWFSLTTTFIGLVCYPFMYKKAVESGKTAIAQVFVGWTLILVIFSPVALNFITKRYITELRFNKVTKIFTVKSLNLVNREVQIQFKQSNVYIPKVPGLFTTFHVDKKRLFLDPAYVKDAAAYQYLIGCAKKI